MVVLFDATRDRNLPRRHVGLGDQLCRGQAPLRRALAPTLPVHWSSEEAVAKLLPACHLGRLYLGRTKTGPAGALDLEEEEEHGGGRARLVLHPDCVPLVLFQPST